MRRLKSTGTFLILGSSIACGHVAAATPDVQGASTDQGAVAAAPEKTPASAPLDLKSLEQRLKDTHAIGVFTKLSLKNEVDDLLSALREYHNGQSQPTLEDLRQRFDLLLLKALTLLQDGDPPLASAISTSREAIWGILANAGEFHKSFG